MSKLSESINARFSGGVVENSASAGTGVAAESAAPSTLDGGGGGGSGSGRVTEVTAAEGTARNARPRLTKLVTGGEKGDGRNAVRDSSAPPFAERAVKGVLRGVLSRNTAKSEKTSDGDAGSADGGVQDATAKRSESSAGGAVGESEYVGSSSAAKEKTGVGEKNFIPRRETGMLSNDTGAATAVQGNSVSSSGSNGSVLDRFGRSNKGSRKTQWSPLPTAGSFGNEPGRDSSGGSGRGKVRRDGKVLSGRVAKKPGVPGVWATTALAAAALPPPLMPASAAAATAEHPQVHGVPPTAASTTPSKSTTGSMTHTPRRKLGGGKRLPEGGSDSRTTTVTATRVENPQRRHRFKTESEEEKEQRGVGEKVMSGSSSTDCNRGLTKKIRVPWANLISGRDPRAEEQRSDSDRMVDTDNDADGDGNGGDGDGGDGEVIKTATKTPAATSGGGGGGGSDTTITEQVLDGLDEIGLGG